MTKRRAATLLAFSLSFLAASASAQTQDVYDVYDVEHVVLSWEAASGPVAGYYVNVSRNAAPPELASVTSGLEATIQGQPGDEVEVTIAAYDVSGAAGPASPPSPLIRFNVTPPSDDPASEEPPPPDDTADAPSSPDDGTDPPPPNVAAHVPFDFNADGTSDLLLRDPAGDLLLWTMDGSVRVSETPLTSLEADWKVVGNGDYDGNGMADLAWQRDGSGEIRLWLLENGQPVGLATPNPTASQGAAAWRVGGSGDFDGDGADDLLLYDPSLGESAIVALEVGGGTTSSLLPGYAGAFAVADVGDYDRDGLAELSWRDDASHDLLAWDLDGTGPDAPSLLSGSFEGWRVVGSGDFDGDGVEDLFAVGSGPTRAEVWLLANSAVAGVVSLPQPAGAEWMAVSVGDFDADGLSDLVWSNTVTGALEIWFSNGASVTRVPVSGMDGSALHSSATVVSGVQGAEDAARRQQRCDGDLDGNRVVDFVDARLFMGCLDLAGGSGCEAADMNRDGTVDALDADLFRRALTLGFACAQ